MDTIVGYGDEPSAVEIADGFFVGFLGDLETVVDEFGGRLVAEVAEAVILVEVAQQHFGKVERLLAA